MTATEAQALKAIAGIIVETVNETPEGAPGGTLYAALMTIGISLEQFEQIMAALVNLGLVRKSGQLYFAR